MMYTRINFADTNDDESRSTKYRLCIEKLCIIKCVAY